MEQDTVLTVTALKWKGGAPASVSITYDAPWGTHPDHRLATDAVIERGMRLDLELVSWIFAKPELHHWIDTYKRDLMPHGIRFFGHGHTHALHDTMEFDEAYESFKKNFDLMQQWGLNPKAYAYPGSSGERLSTQSANQLAGFICARGSTIEWDDYFIAPHDEMDPKNWQFLPSVIMGNASYRDIDVHEKLVPILDETVKQGAWVILTYHAIGIPEGWGYYPVDDFRRDLEAIQARYIWSANMEAAAAYIAERSMLQFTLTGFKTSKREIQFDIKIDDGLPDWIYNEPLTFSVVAKKGLIGVEGPMTSVPTFESASASFESVPDGSVYRVRLSR